MKSLLKKLLNLTTVCSAVLLASSCTSPGGGFAAADRNNDGQIAVAEFETALIESIVASSDTDQNGKVSLAEWSKSNPDADPALFRMRDLNGDGELDLAEARKAADQSDRWDRLMRKIDNNNNMVVDEDEAVAFRKHMEKSEGATPVSKLSSVADE